MRHQQGGLCFPFGTSQIVRKGHARLFRSELLCDASRHHFHRLACTCPHIRCLRIERHAQNGQHMDGLPHPRASESSIPWQFPPCLPQLTSTYHRVALSASIFVSSMQLFSVTTGGVLSHGRTTRDNGAGRDNTLRPVVIGRKPTCH